MEVAGHEVTGRDLDQTGAGSGAVAVALSAALGKTALIGGLDGVVAVVDVIVGHDGFLSMLECKMQNGIG